MTLPGGLVSILILLPNLLWMLFPPRDQPDGGAVPSDGIHRVMSILEWVARIAVLVVPFLYQVDVQSGLHLIALVVFVLALLFYYAAWARYFLRGRRYALLFEPSLGVPLPMAISPIVCFLAASALFASWLLAMATMVLAIAHVWISHQEYQALQHHPDEVSA